MNLILLKKWKFFNYYFREYIIFFKKVNVFNSINMSLNSKNILNKNSYHIIIIK
jgi:hypothetical protein